MHIIRLQWSHAAKSSAFFSPFPLLAQPTPHPEKKIKTHLTNPPITALPSFPSPLSSTLLFTSANRGAHRKCLCRCPLPIPIPLSPTSTTPLAPEYPSPPSRICCSRPSGEVEASTSTSSKEEPCSQ